MNKANNIQVRDVKPQYPKNPHIVLINYFKNNKNFLSTELKKKLIT
jgi:hypothetical protein